MQDWYVMNAGKQLGPLDAPAARLIARESPGAWCWKQGMADWKPIYQVADVRALKKDGVTPFPDPTPDMIQPKPPALPAHASPPAASAPPTSTPSLKRPSFTPVPNASGGYGSGQATDGVDFKLYGTETQFVELELDRGESAVAEAGALMYKTCDVQMETIFGDGSNQSSGLLGSLFGAGKRMLTGESLFTTVFSQQGAGKGRVAFAAPYPGTILPLNLSDFGGKLICQKDSFLAGAKGVSIGIQFQKKILTGLFGGEGFVLQKLEGDGWVFVHMGGTVRKIELAAGEGLDVDTGCLAAMTQTVDYDIRMVGGGIKSMLFGGEGMFFARLTGPGTVWLQSLPFSRLAGRMLAAGPAGVGRSER
ncbi:DUF4339 domain-containing protein [Pseudomonas viridiflava]|uniref:AIM24 family protein n=1 Tax=Pseudomonas viridiflava TaxID=33069 RepID=UPI0015E31CD9|nr:AIM24 family protein [Pseudomonas viridiflava]MBA1229995.1 DUF4339 domain-containing protein [Pseudomonas viridiflava]